MSTLKDGLLQRAEQKCELCGATEDLDVYLVDGSSAPEAERGVISCAKCRSELGADDLDVNHWYCLGESAWSQVPAVQALVWRLLHKLSAEGFAQDLRDQIYLEDDVKAWAESGMESTSSVKVVDSNGTALADGDTVHIIKDLDVKGAGFVAKRGTIVKNIRLGDDPEHIEGRVNKTSIFLKTCFLKKG